MASLLENARLGTLPGMTLLLLSGLAGADVVKPDDLIVQGNGCVGFDCVSGETFSRNGLKLRENNTRVRLEDSSAGTASFTQTFENAYATAELGNRWGLDANESANGGNTQFMIGPVADQASTLLSNGTAPDYDCSVNPPAEVGTLAEGVPVESEVFTGADCPEVTRQVRHKVVAASESGNGIGVGGEAEVVDGAVSLGRAETLRRLVHLADALETTDALIKRQMAVRPFADQRDRADAIAARVDQVEKQIRQLEYQVGIRTRSGSGGGAWGLFLILLALPLVLRRS